MAMIGKPIDRIDAHLKVTGAAKYAAEFNVPNAVHAVLVQSTIAAGSITGFDLKEAESMPGVLMIITPDNAGKLSDPEKVQQAGAGPLLQNKDILFNGQHVAVVVAETFEQAQAAASAVRVTYSHGEVTTSMDAMLGQAYAMTVASVAPSVQAACRALVDKIKDLALADENSGWQGRSRDTLQLGVGMVVGPDRQVPVSALMERDGHRFIEAEAKTQPGEEKQKFSMHAFGAQFAEVRVDPDLGTIRVSRFVGAFDAGNLLNAKTARSQLIGGITYGIGMALLEETLVDGEPGGSSIPTSPNT
jgi:CO/xanthine dehydrogenase Mo-binding subunit